MTKLGDGLIKSWSRLCVQVITHLSGDHIHVTNKKDKETQFAELRRFDQRVKDQANVLGLKAYVKQMISTDEVRTALNAPHPPLTRRSASLLVAASRPSPLTPHTPLTPHLASRHRPPGR